MKALSLLQPWATLIAIGAKRIETRSWNTAYRGPLAIHASKRFPREYQDLCLQEPFRSVLREYGYVMPILSPASLYAWRLEKLPLGCVVATCELVDVQPTHVISDALSGREAAFGDYSPGRFAWFLDNVKPLLTKPIPAKGALGLWEWIEP